MTAQEFNWEANVLYNGTQVGPAGGGDRSGKADPKVNLGDT